MQFTTQKLLHGLSELSPILVGSPTKFYFSCLQSSGMESEPIFSNRPYDPARNGKYSVFITYISQLQEHLNKSVSCFICIKDVEIAAIPVVQVPLIILQDASVTLNQVSAAMMDMILETQHYDELKDVLLDMLSKGFDIKTMLKTATKYLGNPLSFLNSSFRYIAHSFSDELLRTTLEGEIDEEGYVCGKMLMTLRNSGDLGRIQSSDKVEFTAVPNGINKITIALRPNGLYIGLFSMYDLGRPLQDSDADILEYISKIVCAYIAKNPYLTNSIGDAYESLINDLVCNISQSPNIAASIDILGMKFSSHMAVLLVMPSINETATRNAPLRLIRQQLDSILPFDKKVVLGAEGILVLFNMNRSEPLTVSVKGKLLKYLQANSLYAAFSNVFYSIFDIKSYCEQARISIRLGMHYEPDERLYYYENYAVRHIISICSEHSDLLKLCHPAVGVIRDYDAKYGTSYYITLKTYIECNHNISECAGNLGIHYNTVRYRVKMIQSLCNIELNNIETFFHLQLSIKMYDYIEIPKPIVSPIILLEKHG